MGTGGRVIVAIFLPILGTDLPFDQELAAARVMCYSVY